VRISATAEAEAALMELRAQGFVKHVNRGILVRIVPNVPARAAPVTMERPVMVFARPARLVMRGKIVRLSASVRTASVGKALQGTALVRSAFRPSPVPNANTAMSVSKAPIYAQSTRLVLTLLRLTRANATLDTAAMALIAQISMNVLKVPTPAIPMPTASIMQETSLVAVNTGSMAPVTPAPMTMSALSLIKTTARSKPPAPTRPALSLALVAPVL